MTSINRAFISLYTTLTLRTKLVIVRRCLRENVDEMVYAFGKLQLKVITQMIYLVKLVNVSVGFWRREDIF